MAGNGFGMRRVGARRRWALAALAALAFMLFAVACGDAGGGESSARWDTAVWGSARWAP